MKNKKIVLGLAITLSVIIGAYLLIFGNKKTDNTIYLPQPASYKNLKPNLGFEQIYPEPEFKNLSLFKKAGRFGTEGDDAKVIRAWRFKNITDAVEARYNLPHCLILAMVIIESNGIDLLPNSQGDGGFGLCHMQPATAHEFGLHTYQNCQALICDGKHSSCCQDKKGRKLNHAKALANLIKAKGYDKRLLIEFDDRLHPVLNLDAVGRMLASHIKGKRIGKLSRIETAIYRYAGPRNYHSYQKKVRYYTALLRNADYIAGLEERFNKANPNLEINSQKGDFDLYIQVSQEQNFNYGLAEYQKLPRYR